MYNYLTELKRLKAIDSKDPGGNEARFADIDGGLDELIEAFNVTEDKCELEGFLMYRYLLVKFEGYKQLAYYVSYLKQRLGYLCIKGRDAKISSRAPENYNGGQWI